MYCLRSNPRRGNGDGIPILVLALIVILFISPFVVGNIRNCFEPQKQYELSDHRNVISGIVRTIECSNQKTRIIFKNGENKTFLNISPTPIKTGDHVVITFDGNNHILKTEIK